MTIDGWIPGIIFLSIALILFNSISAFKLLGIILFILSAKPPPVIFAHPLIKLLSINLSTSLT